MGEKTPFESVWDALEDDPVRQENLKLRSELMITISETIKGRGLKQQQEVADLLHISQPRVSALLKGKIDEFRLVILGAWSMGWLESLQVLSRHQKTLEVMAGITLIVTGLYLLNEYFFIIIY